MTETFVLLLVKYRVHTGFQDFRSVTCRVPRAE